MRRVALLLVLAIAWVQLANPSIGAASAKPPLVAAAGDIACPRHPCTAQRRTARAILGLKPDAVLTLGDNQYDRGSLAAFRASYDPTWGAFRAITYPVPGNHDYGTPRAAGYFRYFGSRAHRGHGGFYSFDLGSWHLVALNSPVPSKGQTRWLRKDLRRDHAACELAYFHEPRFSSGRVHGGSSSVRGWWRILFRAGVDVVLSGHEHQYERFARLTPGGAIRKNGIREFVVGTGGVSLYPFGRAVRGSKRRVAAYGVLALQLRSLSYRWRFLKTSGAVGDRGATPCHR